MISRKKKIITIQIFLFLVSIFVIYVTYLKKDNSTEKIFSKEVKSKIDNKISNDNVNGNTFYDIEYSGIDLSGNRYVLKAKEANEFSTKPGFVSLKGVNAIFYFKNNKILNISSKFGLYDSNSLDMIFEKKIKAEYDGSILLSERAEYLNSKNMLLVKDNVMVKDIRGQMEADKLLFDITDGTLNISSEKSKNINANINYK